MSALVTAAEAQALLDDYAAGLMPDGPERPELARTVVAQAADNAALRAELDDLRGRLSRTGAALIGAVRVRCDECGRPATKHRSQSRFNFCDRCAHGDDYTDLPHAAALREATCCACPGDEGSAA